MDQLEEGIAAARRRAEDEIQQARRSGAPSLDLSGRLLGTVPESLRGLTTLTELNLAGNQLTVLPRWLGDLTGLTRLDLAGNRLTAAPRLGVDSRRGEHRVTAPLHAWIDADGTVVAADADLDAVLDRTPPSGVSLVSEDGGRTLHLVLAADRSALIWEDESDSMLSWGRYHPAPHPA